MSTKSKLGDKSAQLNLSIYLFIFYHLIYRFIIYHSIKLAKVVNLLKKIQRDFLTEGMGDKRKVHLVNRELVFFLVERLASAVGISSRREKKGVVIKMMGEKREGKKGMWGFKIRICTLRRNIILGG